MSPDWFIKLNSLDLVPNSIVPKGINQYTIRIPIQNITNIKLKNIFSPI